jgi:hypothetical protein
VPICQRVGAHRRRPSKRKGQNGMTPQKYERPTGQNPGAAVRFPQCKLRRQRYFLSLASARRISAGSSGSLHSIDCESRCYHSTRRNGSTESALSGRPLTASMQLSQPLRLGDFHYHDSLDQRHRLREKTESGTPTSLQGPRWAGHEHARTRKLIRAVNGLARRGTPRTVGCQASNVDATPHHDQGRHNQYLEAPDQETGRTSPSRISPFREL